MAAIATTLTHAGAWLHLRRSHAARRSGVADSVASSVSVIVPVRGLDAETEANVAALLGLAHTEPWEVLFVVEDEGDPVLPLLERLLAGTDAPAWLVVGGQAHHGTGKVRNLLSGIAESRYDVLAFVDVDVRVGPGFLREAVQAVEDEAVGLAFAVPTAQGARDVWAALHNHFVNASALHYLAQAGRDALEAAVGSTIVMRRAVIEEVGGLESLADRVVGIDISMGQAVRNAGYRIGLLPKPARVIHKHDQPERLWRQLHRWMVTIRRYYPAFPLVGLIAALPASWLVAFTLTSARQNKSEDVRLGGMLLAGIALLQAMAAAVTNEKLVRDPNARRYLWVAPFAEAFWLPVFVHSLVTDEVHWRGRRLRVHRDRTGIVIN
jgi:ceramide glucosyltransferase